jgi:hypothetical protein
VTVAGLRDLAGRLAGAVERLEPELLSGADAEALMEAFDDLSRICAAGRLLAARRAAQCSRWRAGGRHPTPGRWLAERTGVPVGDAERQLATAERLQHLPDVEGAFRRGELSPAQADEIAGAAATDPAAQADLLDAARRTTFGQLRGRCRRLRQQAASAEDDAARARRMHGRRRASFGTDDEGMATLHAVLPPDQLARLKRVVDTETDRIFEQARKDGRDEPLAAHRADALVALVERGGGGDRSVGDGGGTRRCSLSAHMLIRADLEALRRGYTVGDEVCDIPGVGEVPVAAARRLLGEALLTLVITDGVDVRTIFSLKRHVPAALDLALMWRDPTCVVPGCDRTVGLERDHWQVDFGDEGPTCLDNLARLCRPHHHDKTYRGFTLAGGPGRWEWIPPPGSEDPTAGAPATTGDPTAGPAPTSSRPPRRRGRARSGPRRSGGDTGRLFDRF